MIARGAPAGSVAWFAHHELRLAWRDWMAMVTGGKRAREVAALIGLAVFVAVLHAIAYAVLAAPLKAGVVADKPTLVLLTGVILLGVSLMLSQAIESVTRAFYTRSDLDLILSSPAPAARLFTVRIGAIVVSTAALSLMMVVPLVVVAVAMDGPRWLAVFPVMLALAAVSTAVALLVAIALFATIGARRTRLIAQIVAAVVGAAFLIGTQVAAILAFGELSRFSLFSSADVIAALPASDSVVWGIARAVMGDIVALFWVVGGCSAVFAVVTLLVAGRFGTLVLAAASVGEQQATSGSSGRFEARTPGAALRAKEYCLLARDPWLVSQSLMQLLYLIPPAVLLWQSFGNASGAVVILAPVLVMAVGQLAGGLAWLAISGEDAPDLVATAPLKPRAVVIAKIQSVLSVVMACAAPFLIVLALINLWVAVVAAVGVLVSGCASMLIQLWFRASARRAMFRRRQTASRTSTFAEAFSSISWAGAAALAAAGSWFALVFIALALIVLAAAWLLAPSGNHSVHA